MAAEFEEEWTGEECEVEKAEPGAGQLRKSGHQTWRELRKMRKPCVGRRRKIKFGDNYY